MHVCMYVLRSKGRTARLKAADKTRLALCCFRHAQRAESALCPARCRGVTWRINFIFLRASKDTPRPRSRGRRRRQALISCPCRGGTARHRCTLAYFLLQHVPLPRAVATQQTCWRPCWRGAARPPRAPGSAGAAVTAGARSAASRRLHFPRQRFPPLAAFLSFVADCRREAHG